MIHPSRESDFFEESRSTSSRFRFARLPRAMAAFEVSLVADPAFAAMGHRARASGFMRFLSRAVREQLPASRNRRQAGHQAFGIWRSRLSSVESSASASSASFWQNQPVFTRKVVISFEFDPGHQQQRGAHTEGLQAATASIPSSASCAALQLLL